MKENQNLTLAGDKVTLVPYRPEHVKKYHAWMQDEELLIATASEKLTLEDEYENQISWANDNKKCTFIIVEGKLLSSNSKELVVSKMVGDVNFFWNQDDSTSGEINMMIAEKGSRRSGIGYEALKIFIAYLISNFGVKIFYAKIGYDNIPSMNLFSKIGFRECSRSDIFREVCLELDPNSDSYLNLMNFFKTLKFGMYD